MSKAKHSHAWSLTGAARAAREARISSAKFLATPAMAQRHRGQIEWALGIHAIHNGGDLLRALADLSRSLGYVLPYPDPDLLSELILQDEARFLNGATLYVLSPDMTDVVVAAALTLTIEDLELIHAETLPTQTGLIVLPHPLITRQLDGDLVDPRGFLWWHPARIALTLSKTVPAVHVATYLDGHGPVQPESWTDFTAMAAAAGTPVPPLLLNSMRSFPYKHRFTDAELQALDRFSSGARQLGSSARILSAELGLHEDQVVGEYIPGQEIEDYDDLFSVKFLFAFWRLAEQRIALTEHAPVNHSAQVTVDRAGVSADVRVVRLRRTSERRTGDGSTGRVDWQHRWPVRMHKVRQWYPSLGTHDLLWRGPYIKGPTDKPLIGGEQVWGLIR